jgi:transposase
MGKKELGTKREYTEEFKVETVRLAESIGGNAAASRLGVPQSTVTNWVRRRKGLVPLTQASSVVARRPASDLEAENMRLRRELANAKLDLDIVKKAAAYFVRESR